MKDKTTGANTLSLIQPNFDWFDVVFVGYGNNAHNDEMALEYSLDELGEATNYGLQPGDRILADRCIFSQNDY
jgi:hypothetical protein